MDILQRSNTLRPVSATVQGTGEPRGVCGQLRVLDKCIYLRLTRAGASNTLCVCACGSDELLALLGQVTQCKIVLYEELYPIVTMATGWLMAWVVFCDIHFYTYCAVLYCAVLYCT